MKYQHRFHVRAPLRKVAEFHGDPAAVAAITPPPIGVQVHRAPPRMAEGDEMDFTLWMGPLPLRWLARFEQVTPSGFVDRMVSGPLRTWEHRHSFVPVDEVTTEVIDEVTAEPSRHPLWGPVGAGLALNLPVLFAYRTWKTRRLLEQPGEAPLLNRPGDQVPAIAVLTTAALASAALAAVAVLAIKRGIREDSGRRSEVGEG